MRSSKSRTNDGLSLYLDVAAVTVEMQLKSAKALTILSKDLAEQGILVALIVSLAEDPDKD